MRLLRGLSCSAWMKALLITVVLYGSTVINGDVPQTENILSEVIKELSAAKVSMESTRDQLVNAEHSVKKLYQSALDQKAQTSQPQGFKGHKLVHLDLTGAPPKISYLLELIPFCRAWGATGFLVEYGSNFPFVGDLQIITDPSSAYSKEEITMFLRECSKNNLVVIPIIQTFGHLEFVLKHDEFAHLRETKPYTNSLCPSNKGSLPLIKKMIDQILNLHPSAQWLHVGGDEVWNLKTCEKCKNSNFSEADVFLRHMVPVLTYVRDKKRTAIMWDDMMREWTIQQLQSVSQLVEPMLWGYRSPLFDILPQEMWAKYGAAFPRVWMASAFKGAYRSNADFVRINLRLQNNLEFVKSLTMLPSTTQVMGIALTGWSRYDHFGTLCELLPASIPSLAICLTAVNQGYMDIPLLTQISKGLGFQKTINIDQEYAKDLSDCEATFPGHEVYKLVCKLSKAHHKLELAIDTKNSWSLPRQLKAKELSFFRIKFGNSISSSCINLYQELKTESAVTLSKLYSESTVDEWIQDKIDENIKAAEKVHFHFQNVFGQLNKEMKKIEEKKEGNEQFETDVGNEKETDASIAQPSSLPKPTSAPTARVTSEQEATQTPAHEPISSSPLSLSSSLSSSAAAAAAATAATAASPPSQSSQSSLSSSSSLSQTQQSEEEQQKGLPLSIRTRHSKVSQTMIRDKDKQNEVKDRNPKRYLEKSKIEQ